MKTLRKNDLPELICEPTSVEELQVVLKFAAEKGMRVAVASGQAPTAVQELESALLILTHRLAGPSQLSKDGLGMWVYSGSPLEAVAVELAQRGLTWMPLHPLEPGRDTDHFVRAWCGRITLPQIGRRSVECLTKDEWVGYDEEALRDWARGLVDVDLTPLLFGSGARYGVFRNLEIALETAPKSRTMVLCECESVEELARLHQTWQFGLPLPNALPFSTKTTTNALRQGNDNFVSEDAVAMLACEWEGTLELDARFTIPHQRVEGTDSGESVVAELVQIATHA